MSDVLPGHWERVEVNAYPEEWYHLHGKAMSGLRHSHPLKPGEDPDKPSHVHEGEPGEWNDWHAKAYEPGDPDRRGVGPAIYWIDEHGEV